MLEVCECAIHTVCSRYTTMPLDMYLYRYDNFTIFNLMHPIGRSHLGGFVKRNFGVGNSVSTSAFWNRGESSLPNSASHSISEMQPLATASS